MLLIISTGTNIFYSVNSFIEDKKAYLLETVLNKTEQISDQISREFKVSDYLAELYSNHLTVTPNSRKNENYLATIKTDSLNKSPAFIYQNDQSPYLNLDLLNDFINEVVTLEQQPIINHLMVTYFKNEILIYKTYLNNEEKVFVTHFFNIQKITESLNNNPQISNFIALGKKQANIIGTRIIDQSKITEFLNSKIQKQSFEEKIVGDQEESQEYLIALNKNIEYDFIVGSAISTKVAFNTTKTIIIKSVLFSLFLLGLFIIFGILFSSQITTPIKELTIAATNTANGIYDYKENISSRDELKLLGVSFELMNTEINSLLNAKEDMIQELDAANIKLDHYNKNLEKMVAERTKLLNESNNFITAMINSLDQGLVVFDSQLKIKPIFTKASQEIFSMNPHEKNLPELLRKNSPEEIAKLEQWSQVTFSNLLPFESAVGLGPQDIQFGNSVEEENYKFVEIKYYPMKNEKEELQNIVAVATDKTTQRINDFNFQKQESYVQMILKILNNKTSFHSFVQEVHHILGNFKDCYEPETNKLNLELAMMLFHTLNGGFGLYRTLDLQRLARANEQFIVDSKPGLNTPNDISQMAIALAERVTHYRQEFLSFLQELDKKLGTTFSSNQVNKEIPTKILKEYFSQISEIATATQSPLLINVADVFENNFLKSPVRNFLKSYEELCEKTASKIGKELKPFHYINGDLMLNPDHFDSFFNVIVHLFRNNLDHGIELPAKRIELGKNQAGLITIEAFESSENTVISITDDGAGINPETIRARWAKLNSDYDINSENDEDVIYRIFEPNFSTKDVVTELSGRGVGMSAIKDVVDQMGATIIINSKVNVGSKFTFTFPK